MRFCVLISWKGEKLMTHFNFIKMSELDSVAIGYDRHSFCVDEIKFKSIS